MRVETDYREYNADRLRCQLWNWQALCVAPQSWGRRSVGSIT